MKNPLLIATRASKLALYQANLVLQHIEQKGISGKLITIQTKGDIHAQEKINELADTGIFTKELDQAVLNHDADIAIHSLKDLPTRLPDGLQLAAVLPRGSYQDVAVVKSKKQLAQATEKKMVVATGSIRRAAQWLSKYPQHTILSIRGNVDSRIRRFETDSGLDVLILARAGLERLQLLSENVITLDWMMPAPAQGIIGIVCRSNDDSTLNLCQTLNHTETYMAAHIERDFLQTLHGGCAIPISALAVIHDQQIMFRGAIHAIDGSNEVSVNLSYERAWWQKVGKLAAETLLEQKDAVTLLESIRKHRNA